VYFVVTRIYQIEKYSDNGIDIPEQSDVSYSHQWLPKSKNART